MIDHYLDLAKEQNHYKNDAQLAIVLNVSRVTIHKWRNGGSVSQESLEKLARLCKVKPEVLIAEYELSKEHSPQVRAMWERIKKTAAVVGLATALNVTSNLGELGSVQAEEINNNIYYVK